MEDRETPRMRKYGESKRTRIMMATVPHVTSSVEENFRPMDFCWTECTIFINNGSPSEWCCLHICYVHWPQLNIQLESWFLWRI